MTRISGHFAQPVPVEAPLSAAEQEAIEQNPFRRIRGGSYRSPRAIADLIRRDPIEARRLCLEAGEHPENWMPERGGPGSMSKALGR